MTHYCCLYPNKFLEPPAGLRFGAVANKGINMPIGDSVAGVLFLHHSWRWWWIIIIIIIIIIFINSSSSSSSRRRRRRRRRRSISIINECYDTLLSLLLMMMMISAAASWDSLFRYPTMQFGHLMIRTGLLHIKDPATMVYRVGVQLILFCFIIAITITITNITTIISIITNLNLTFWQSSFIAREALITNIFTVTTAMIMIITILPSASIQYFNSLPLTVTILSSAVVQPTTRQKSKMAMDNSPFGGFLSHGGTKSSNWKPRWLGVQPGGNFYLQIILPAIKFESSISVQGFQGFRQVCDAPPFAKWHQLLLQNPVQDVKARGDGAARQVYHFNDQDLWQIYRTIQTDLWQIYPIFIYVCRISMFYVFGGCSKYIYILYYIHRSA